MSAARLPFWAIVMKAMAGLTLRQGLTTSGMPDVSLVAVRSPLACSKCALHLAKLNTTLDCAILLFGQDNILLPSGHPTCCSCYDSSLASELSAKRSEPPMPKPSPARRYSRPGETRSGAELSSHPAVLSTPHSVHRPSHRPLSELKTIHFPARAITTIDRPIPSPHQIAPIKKAATGAIS